MSSRFPSHQLTNGLFVSGRPEPAKEKPPTMSSAALPYTGGDIKKSGELGKMFDVDHNSSRPRKSGPITNAPLRTGSFGGVNTSHPNQTLSQAANRMGSGTSGVVSGLKRTSSGPLNKHGEPIRKSSGPQGGGMTSASRQNSGPIPPILPATGLLISGPLNSSGVPTKVSGPLDSTRSIKSRSTSMVKIQAVTYLGEEDGHSFVRSFPKLVFWSVFLLFVMGFISAIFIFAAVGNPVLLAVVVVLFIAVTSAFAWNACWGRKAVINFIARYPDAELRTAKNGQFVKVSGVVTCGNVPLESSFQRVPRCVYTSTCLYEYRGWGSKAANTTHRRFTWGPRSIERHVTDFYISDFQSGLRALVKTGYGARVTPYVEDSVVIDIDHSNKHASPQFTKWLGEKNISSDAHVMRLKEGYIKEGSTVSVLGVVQRNDNVVMIVPPSEPVPTGCQWTRCILPASLEGVVLRCEDSSKLDVIAV